MKKLPSVRDGTWRPHVHHAGLEAPAGYAPPLVSNGDLALRLGPLGDLQNWGSDYIPAPLFRVGRRYGSPCEFRLISFGYYALDTWVDGTKLVAPLAWTQTLDLKRGCVVNQVEYPGGIAVTTTVFASLTATSSLLIRREVIAPGKVVQRLRYTLSEARGSNHDALASPRGMLVQPPDIRKGGDVPSIILPYQAEAQYSFTGVATLGTFARGASEDSIHLEASGLTLDSEVQANTAEWALVFEDTLHNALAPEKNTVEACEERACAQVQAFAACGGVTIALEVNAAEWAAFWAVGGIEVPDGRIQQMYLTALYHLRCNATRWSQPVGILNESWGSRYFGWDEFFCQMGLLTTGHAELARRVPEYRASVLPLAQARVGHYLRPGKFGARYAWESLEDGTDGTPIGFWNEHVFHQSNIAAGTWAQYEETGDLAYLSTTGWPILRDMARFFFTHTLYEDSNGGLYVGKFTDMERLGPAKERAFLTTCGVLYTFRVAAAAARILGVADEEAASWTAAAARLRPSLPEHEGRFTALPDASAESVAVLGGLFPYPLFDRMEPRAVGALHHFISIARTAGNMYPTGNRVCTWYAGWLSAACAAAGEPEAALQSLREAADACGRFGECWEINEPGVMMSRPWFATASGMVVLALNRMLVQSSGNDVQFASGIPTAWSDFAFSLPCGDGRFLQARVESGKVELLTVFRNENGSKIIEENPRVLIPRSFL